MASKIEKDCPGTCCSESLHPVQEEEQESQTATIASALAKDGSAPSPTEQLIRYTPQELLSLRPHEGDKQAVTANATTVDEIQVLKPVTEQNPVDSDPPLALPDPEKSPAILTDPTSGWGDTEIDNQNPDQTNPITQAEFKESHGENGPAELTEKKKKRTSGKKKKAQPTGFEEFYADPPLTSHEHDEELNEIYHPSRTFVERIQQCIQRYRARRKLNSSRAHYFNKYLALGGVDTGMKAFNGGLEDDTLDTYDAKEIAEIQATDHIRSGTSNPKFYDASAPEHWVVDFEGVAKGFLSHRAPACWGIDYNTVKEYCGVIRNFLNYVLTHSVCPEYTTNILAAKRICDDAERELPMIKEVSSAFPGDFNTAASSLYGGRFKGLYIENLLWPGEVADTEISQDHRRRISGMTISEAERIFKTAVVFVGTYDNFKTTMAESSYVVSKSDRYFEVMGICLPSHEMRMKFGGTKDETGNIGNIKALGVLKVKHWDNPGAEPEDLTDDEDSPPHLKVEDALLATESFWLEESILEKCWVGMKFGATVRELNTGIKYFDFISGVYPTFYTYLPAEWLEDWREPKANPRGPPMVGDFDHEDEDLDCEKDEDREEGLDYEDGLDREGGEAELNGNND